VKTKAKFIVLIAAVTALVMTFGTAAWANSTSGHQFAPHPEPTNKCLTCHDIHEAEADYVLLREATVTETCATCHNLYLDTSIVGGAPVPAGDEIGGAGSGVFPAWSGTLATTSDRSAYKTTDAVAHSGHTLPEKAADLLEVGMSGNLTAIQIWAQPPTIDDPDTWQGYSANAPFLTDATDFTATGGLYCASCHTPHGAYGQQISAATQVGPNWNGGQHQNKLLSSRPNHNSDVVSVPDWAGFGSRWCLACHDRRAPDHAAGLYNHPSTMCLDCHADLRGPTEYDFPHTSDIGRLLAEEPDTLCINCHGPGSNPLP
jgi:predicted CXXCH cytochrome family protein